MSTRDQLRTETTRSATGKRRGPHILSTLLFLTAIGFAAVAAYLYWEEQQEDKNEPTPPAAEPGSWTLAQVRSALDTAGFDTDVGRTNGHTDQIPATIPGQIITVDGTEVYIFIFSRTAESDDPAGEAKATYDDMDLETLTLTRQSSRDVIAKGDELTVFQGSNIIAIMVGGEEEDVEKVRTAIEGLN